MIDDRYDDHYGDDDVHYDDDGGDGDVLRDELIYLSWKIDCYLYFALPSYLVQADQAVLKHPNPILLYVDLYQSQDWYRILVSQPKMRYAMILFVSQAY